MAFGAVTAGASPNVWVALACVALGGAGNGAANVYNVLLVQRGAPDRLRGRVFTAMMSVTFAVFGAGMIVGGPITDAVGARWVYAGGGAVTALAALVGRAMTRHVDAGAADDPDVEPVSAVG
jgi:MFS family permease